MKKVPPFFHLMIGLPSHCHTTSHWKQCAATAHLTLTTWATTHRLTRTVSHAPSSSPTINEPQLRYNFRSRNWIYVWISFTTITSLLLYHSLIENQNNWLLCVGFFHCYHITALHCFVILLLLLYHCYLCLDFLIVILRNQITDYFVIEI